VRSPPAAMLVLQCDVTNPDPVPAKRYIDPSELGTGADTRTGLVSTTTLISDAHFAPEKNKKWSPFKKLANDLSSLLLSIRILIGHYKTVYIVYSKRRNLNKI